VIGLLTAIAAGAAFLVSSAPEIRKLVAWNDSVQLLQYSETEGLVFLNDGDGRLFLSHINQLGRHPKTGEALYSQVLTLNVNVDPGAILTFPLPVIEEDQQLSKPFTKVLPTKSDEEFYVALGRSGSRSKLKSSKICYEQATYSSNDHGLANFRRSMGNLLRTFPIDAELYYYSAKTGRLVSKKVDLTGILIYAPTRPCTE
jgi:hypothetical protein